MKQNNKNLSLLSESDILGYKTQKSIADISTKVVGTSAAYNLDEPLSKSSCCFGKTLSLLSPQIFHKYFEEAVFHLAAHCFSHFNWELSGQFFAKMDVALCR